jgi:RNA polymerase sigma-70 factor (ECF subfamily)
VEEPNQISSFEAQILPHLGAAYNLARWLTRNNHDADDVVQEAYLRALRFWGTFRGHDARAWMLTIVRNTCFTWMQQHRQPSVELEPDLLTNPSPTPEAALLANIDAEQLHRAIEELPNEFREVIVLRELEGLSYKEISSITSVPMGTVMSRLARARSRLQQVLSAGLRKGGAV